MPIGGRSEREPRGPDSAERARPAVERRAFGPASAAATPVVTPARAGARDVRSSDRADALAPLLARAVLARQEEAPPIEAPADGGVADAALDDDLVLTPEQFQAELGALDATTWAAAEEAEEVEEVEPSASDELLAARMPVHAAERVVQRVRVKKGTKTTVVKKKATKAKAPAGKVTKRRTAKKKGPKAPSTGGAPVARPLTAITWTAFLAARRKGTAHAGCVYADAGGEYVIPLRFPNFEKRSDRDVLNQSLAAIAKHMMTYGRRVANVKKVVVGRARGSHLAKVTEGTGETGATAFVLNNYPGFALVHPFGPGRGIDQVWLKQGTPDHYLLVEAKGPGAGLSGDEMTLAWVQRKAHEMRTDVHGQAIGRAVGKVGGKVTRAGGTVPQVTGIVLRASWTTAGTLTATKLALPGGGREKDYN